MTDWKPHALRLADQLQASGDLRTQAWHAAIAETPRHVLVPTVYEPQQQFYGSRTDVRLNTADHLELVYSTTTLVTTVAPNKYGSLMSVSSSTKPDLMVRMLEALDVREGQQILEIGTGTGYNAALLAHRLGDDHVFSVDIDPELVNTARRRLTSIGHHPHLAAQNGAEGWRQHAPYDRIICTCAVRRIPWEWYDQLTPGGQLLVDFKPQGGNLVLLERKTERLEGRFTAWYGAFMVMRQHGNDDDRSSPQWQPELPLDRQRITRTPAEPSGVVRFLRSVTSTTQLRHGYAFDERNRQPTAIKLTAADGSCCEVALTPADNGTRTVREGGPTQLWAEIERAYQQWSDWGEPGWDRVGITVRPQAWTVWLDEPHNIICQVPPRDEQAEAGRA
ncbi:MAG: methyltransferase domain-containing protein [Pseudonocardiaceae bacterium]